MPFSDMEGMPSAQACVEELVRYFPLFGIIISKGKATAQQTQILSIDAANGPCNGFFWSAMQIGASGQLSGEDLAEHCEEDLLDVASVDAEICDQGGVGRGRPRLEDERRLGPLVVEFVENLITNRGQRVVDGHRVDPIQGVFGASLPWLAGAVQEHFGQSVSKAGIRNLLAKTRPDSTHSGPRGLIDARLARVVPSEKKAHPRARWSSTLFKYDKQWLALASANGATCFQLHGDDMCKVPIGIPARRGARVRGFGIHKRDGQPMFEELGHSFPIAQRFLLSTGGWVFCQAPQTKTEVPGPKPQLKTARPDTMHCFTRVTRYAPGSLESHLKDMLDAVEAEGVHESEMGLIGVDNGGDYAIKNPIFQHILLRLFRKKNMVVLICDAHAPYHSSWHWEIESQWSVAYTCLLLCLYS